jgi:hypothetical protein
MMMIVIVTDINDISVGDDNDSSWGQIYNCSDVYHDFKDTLIIQFSCHLSTCHGSDSGGTVGPLAFLHQAL